MSVKKGKAPKLANAPSGKHSGRLAAKVLKKGNKSTEEMAQEVMCKKLEAGTGWADKGEMARDRLLKLFDTSLPGEAIEAIENLLKVINLEGQP
jgi:hypothetical protein